jgi:hypothetical protein
MLSIFKYRKDNGNVSDRVVFELEKPSNYLFGIDLSEFDASERAMYIDSLQEIEEAARKAMTATIEALGLKNNFRRFKASGIEKD